MRPGFDRIPAGWGWLPWLITILIFAVMALALLLVGCTPVVMDAEYTELLETETHRSAAIAGLALNGKLDAEQMRFEIMRAAAVLRHFKDAKDGLRPEDYVDKPQ